MTSEQHDPRATFLADQAEAQSETEKREAQSWALNIRNGEAQAFAQEAHGVHTAAKAALLEAIAHAVAVLSVAASLHALKRLVTKR